jgi:ubiquinone/menaquinone biosynthesis C-methylase UbiE
MLKEFFLNMRKPNGFGGSIMLKLMNWGHDSLAKWGLSYLDIKKDDIILDIGCGSGKNISRMLNTAANGKVYGLDYSKLSVEKSLEYNKKEIKKNRCEIKQGTVSDIPYAENMFNIVTAFETIYFWPNFINDLKGIIRILKSGGIFFICNEEVREDGKEAPNQYFVKILDLKIYSPNELKETLIKAGFIDVQIILSDNKKHICAIAKKP